MHADRLTINTATAKRPASAAARFCSAVVAAALSVGLQAQPAPTPAAPSLDEPTFLATWHVEPGTKVVYQDELGQAISYAAFAEQRRERRSLSKGTRDGVTVFRLMDKNYNGAAMRASALAQVKVQPGQPLPPFDLPGLDGQRRDNVTLNGRYSLINFFFAACVPCILEIPSLNTFRDKHPELNVMAFTYDDVATAKAFQARYRFNWPIVAETGPFNKALGAMAYPSFALVDPQGRLVAYTMMGNAPSPDEASGKLEHQKLAAWVKATLPAK